MTVNGLISAYWSICVIKCNDSDTSKSVQSICSHWSSKYWASLNPFSWLLSNAHQTDVFPCWYYGYNTWTSCDSTKTDLDHRIILWWSSNRAAAGLGIAAVICILKCTRITVIWEQPNIYSGRVLQMYLFLGFILKLAYILLYG